MANLNRETWIRIPNSFVPPKEGTLYPPRGDVYFRNDRYGFTNPGWRQRAKAGFNASSPYSCDICEVGTASPISARLKIKYKIGFNPDEFLAPEVRVYGGFLTSMSVPSHLIDVITPEQENQALGKLYKQIKSASQQMSGLTFLGELRETIALIRKPASALRENTERYLKTIKSTRQQVNRRVKQRKGESKQDFSARRANAVKNGLAGSWLEYRFGVLPLLNDIEDLVETLWRTAFETERRTSARGTSSSAKASVSLSPLRSGYSDGAAWDISGSTSSSASVAYRCGMRFLASGPSSSIERFAQLSGLTFREFVPTAWELMPYSFLIDYFVNVGDIIEAAFTDTSSVFWATRTTRLKTESTRFEFFHQSDRVNDPDTAGYFLPLQCEGKLSSFRRLTRFTLERSDVSSNLPLPSLSVSLPGSGSTKWANVAALLVQARDFKYR